MFQHHSPLPFLRRARLRTDDVMSLFSLSPLFRSFKMRRGSSPRRQFPTTLRGGNMSCFMEAKLKYPYAQWKAESQQQRNFGERRNPHYNAE